MMQMSFFVYRDAFRSEIGTVDLSYIPFIDNLA